MIPLLFVQSLLIGAGFGIGYQGERRKLSAMSNEEFNKTNLGMHAFDEFKGILARQDFGQMLNLMHPLTDKLATAFGELLQKMPSLAGSVIDTALGNPPPSGNTRIQAPGVASFISALPLSVNPQSALAPVQEQIDRLKTPARKFSSVETYVSTWIDVTRRTTHYTNITLAQAKYILGEFSKGNLGQEFLFARGPLVKKLDDLQPKILTSAEQNIKTQEVIKQTATGLVAEIAMLYQRIINAFNHKDRVKSRQLALTAMKTYNRFVQLNRKPHLAVDTMKSLNAHHPVGK